MSKVTDAFTIVNVQCSLFTRINFLLVKHVFNDPSSLNYVADFVNHFANVESECYRVGIIYHDTNRNDEQNFVLFDQYVYPLQRTVNHVTPVGVGVFLLKDSPVIDRSIDTLGNLYPSVNFAVSDMGKSKIFKLNRPFFGSDCTPYEDADEMIQTLYKNAYDAARGMLVTLKVHDKPVE